MKILKNKTYALINEKISIQQNKIFELERLNEFSADIIHEYKQLFNNAVLATSTRLFVFGGKGQGKTTYINKTLTHKIGRQFIIINGLDHNEYSENNLFYKHLSVNHTLTNEILDIISKNLDKVFIVENVFFSDRRNVDLIIQILMNFRHINLIISSHRPKDIPESVFQSFNPSKNYVTERIVTEDSYRRNLELTHELYGILEQTSNTVLPFTLCEFVS